MRLVALLLSLLSVGLAAGHSVSVSLDLSVRLSDALSPKPSTVPTRPQTPPAKTQAGPAKPQAVSAKPQAVSAKPQAVSAKPQAVAAKMEAADRTNETTGDKNEGLPLPGPSTMSNVELYENALDFAMGLLSNSSKSLYGEQVELLTNKGDDSITKWTFGTLLKLRLRSSRTNCFKGNETCTLLKPLSRPEDSPSVLGNETQGPLYMPFIAPFNETLSPGKTIKIEGRTLKFPETVYVYIRSGTGPELVYVPLVIQILYSEEKTIVDMYHISEGKQVEEVNKYKNKLLALGQPFSIQITVLENKYNIIINNKSFDYPVRIPYKGATHLEVNAEAILTNVEGTAKVAQRGLVEAPATPLVLPIHDLPLKSGVGRVIGVGGYILPAAASFEIRLQNTPDAGRYTAASIVLNFSFKKRGLMIKHFINKVYGAGKWHPATQWFRRGREKGQPFYMEFHFEEKSLACVFHGDWSIRYPYHVPLESANHLVIIGDLQVNRITGLDTVRDCSADILDFSNKMWAGSLNCTGNYALSYARYGNVPIDS